MKTTIMSFSLTQSFVLKDFRILFFHQNMRSPTLTNQEQHSLTVYRIYCTSSNTHIVHVTSKTFVTHCFVWIRPKNQFHNSVNKFSSSTLISAQFT